MTTKRKVSLSLDDDLIEALGDESALSAQVNEAVRNEVERRRRHQALGRLLDRLDELDGPLDTAKDEAEIARFARLLGGTA
jgi:antitoxin CcdA